MTCDVIGHDVILYLDISNERTWFINYNPASIQLYYLVIEWSAKKLKAILFGPILPLKKLQSKKSSKIQGKELRMVPFKTAKEPKMKFFDFGEFQINGQMFHP